ncbi:MAG TPA: hypothetical protein P5230_00045 [Candidatus Magasanikbacteria bacterium]|nr:hypothetical protein [Candidatus Magasanikbacteria bacterium]
MFKTKILIFTAFLAGLMFCLPVYAQTETTTAVNDTVTDTVSGPITATATTTDGTVKTYGTWGLLWLDLKEKVILTFTLDSVKKAEKLTQLADQRLKMAEAFIQKSQDNPKMQEKAEKMLEKANSYMAKVEERKTDIINKAGEKGQALLKKAADQSLRRDETIKKIEDRLSPENIQKMEEMRLRGLENSQRLINAIGNENISSSTKAHLEEVKVKVEARLLQVKTFVETKKELLEKAQNGDASAIEELKKIRQERLKVREEAKKLMEEKREVQKEVRSEVKEIRKENRMNSSTSL